MRIKITIDTDEVLIESWQDVAESITRNVSYQEPFCPESEGRLYDGNGDRCGRWAITKD